MTKGRAPGARPFVTSQLLEDAVAPWTDKRGNDKQDDADQDVAADKTQDSVDRDDDRDDPQDERHGCIPLLQW